MGQILENNCITVGSSCAHYHTSTMQHFRYIYSAQMVCVLELSSVRDQLTDTYTDVTSDSQVCQRKFELTITCHTSTAELHTCLQVQLHKGLLNM